MAKGISGSGRLGAVGVSPAVACSAFAAVVLRPSLWRVAAKQLRLFARPGWWRRAPFLPLPDRCYLGFRLQTMYGSDGGIRTGDLIAWLRWCETIAVSRERPTPRRGRSH